MISTHQYIDPEVTKLKFDKELDLFNASKVSQRKRGIILLDATFPNVYLAFSVVALKPVPIIFAVKINFENYDLEPPSVVFIDPFTFEAQDKTIPFLRKIPNSPQPQNLVQKNKGKLPFFCIPGVREYHSHPAHTGDSWLLHRKVGGEGSLGFIIENLYNYGVVSIKNYQTPIINVSTLSLGIDINSISV